MEIRKSQSQNKDHTNFLSLKQFQHLLKRQYYATTTNDSKMASVTCKTSEIFVFFGPKLSYFLKPPMNASILSVFFSILCMVVIILMRLLLARVRKPVRAHWTSRHSSHLSFDTRNFHLCNFKTLHGNRAGSLLFNVRSESTDKNQKPPI